MTDNWTTDMDIKIILFISVQFVKQSRKYSKNLQGVPKKGGLVDVLALIIEDLNNLKLKSRCLLTQ